MTPKPVTLQQAEKAYYLAAIDNYDTERAKFAVEASFLQQQLDSATQLAAAEREKLDAEIALINLEADDKRRSMKWEGVIARERRVYDIVGDVNEYGVGSAVDDINDWATVSLEPITIRLCSPGGSVFDGLFLFDYVQEVRRLGIHVTTYALGYAASMGSILSQAGDVRAISRNSWFMIHEPASLAWGKAGDIRREAELLDRLHIQLSGILAERSTLTAEDVAARSSDKDWWMPAAEAVEFGFFDEMR